MRADAARNREAVLQAAGLLFDSADDPAAVSMDDVAAAAGVGKGTLFRRFGDRAGLIRALYELRAERMAEESEAEGGGDGAADDPVDALVRAMDALLRFKIENRALSRALESLGGGSPYTNAAYGHWHGRVTALIAEARGPEAADFLAHALLAAVRSDLVDHLADWPDARLKAGVEELVRSVCGRGA
ncbi:TetR/AcrR family transcriptional regulator [Nocardiopsis sp. RSe5-2]|uniref:TetR/AcrR family transcriptional regulator n=1 Tax=Nocardiopsis endophytica TaxID=3018445 RepID=A0ABT4U1R1_9ACTN|nr:TetR/AcrR family transcriptional regulator [Nocardiopsis endophytica]MDA2810888.1 TetR/AcrR family transcriptional regulator [Nocardiopsis endophytica]